MTSIYGNTHELIVFFVYIAVGIVLACSLHTVVYPLRKYCKTSWLCHFIESVTGSLEATAVWLFNNAFNDGVFRMYIVFALVIGFVLYYFICKPTLDNLWKALYNLPVKKLEGDDNAQNIDK